MGWEHREGQHSVWHHHALKKYSVPRKYMPDFVSREKWGAQPAWEEPDRLRHPVPHINMMYTETLPCNTVEECSTIIQKLQNDHIEMGMNDIGYNFLIGGDGRKYEGRGWLYQPERPGRSKSKFKKRKAVDVAIIGSASKYQGKATNIMLEAKRDLLNYGISNKYISCCAYVNRDLSEDAPTYKE